MATRPDLDLVPCFGEPSPELVPAIEPGVALNLPQQTVAGDSVALDGLLSDVLFGEVIDISDLIPRMTEPVADSASPAVPQMADIIPAEAVPVDLGAEFLSSHISLGLTLFYDDDILASDVGIL